MCGNGYELYLMLMYLMLALNLRVVDVKPSVNLPAVNASQHYGNVYQHVVVINRMDNELYEL